MSGQHTQGRLLAATNYAQPELRDEAGNLVAVVAAYQPQDALRMAAAWNACDGITTGNLQTAPGYLAAIAGFHEQRGLAMEARAQRDELLRASQVLGAERIRLEAQRDELLATLAALHQAVSACSYEDQHHDRVYQALLQAGAALQKHQPQAGTGPAKQP